MQSRGMLVALMAVVCLIAGGAAAADVPLACRVAKQKEAGKLAKCLHTAQSKLAVTADAEAYSTAADKCTSKFSVKWQAAEQKAVDKGGTCPTSDDEESVQESVDANVDCIASALETGDRGCMLCGNGVLDTDEDCDFGTLGLATCDSVTEGVAPFGALDCAPGCVFDTSGCAAGPVVGGATWFLSTIDGASCDSVCVVHGLVYDNATRTYAGSDGTDANCAEVLDALGQSGLVLASPAGLGVGCVYSPGIGGGYVGVRDTATTTSSAGGPPGNNIYRACACQ